MWRILEFESWRATYLKQSPRSWPVRETYPVELAKQEFTSLEENNLKNILKSGKEADTLRKLLLPHFEYGPHLLEHLCLEHGLMLNAKLKDVNMAEDVGGLVSAIQAAATFLQTATRTGVIIQKAESRPKHDGGEEEFCTFQVMVVVQVLLM